MPLIELLDNTCFQTIVLTRYMRCFADKEDVNNRIKRKVVKDDEIKPVQVGGKNAKKDGCGRIYGIETALLFWKEIDVCIKSDIMFPQEQESGFWRAAFISMTREYTRKY